MLHASLRDKKISKFSKTKRLLQNFQVTIFSLMTENKIISGNFQKFARQLYKEELTINFYHQARNYMFSYTDTGNSYWITLQCDIEIAYSKLDSIDFLKYLHRNNNKKNVNVSSVIQNAAQRRLLELFSKTTGAFKQRNPMRGVIQRTQVTLIVIAAIFLAIVSADREIGKSLL